MYPHYSKIFGCPTIFVKCWGVVGWVAVKWLYSSWECILSCKWFYPNQSDHDSHFCLKKHLLKMLPGHLSRRGQKFQKIVIFVWWPTGASPCHVCARALSNLTPYFNNDRFAAHFCEMLGEWCWGWNENGCTRAESAYSRANGYSPL